MTRTQVVGLWLLCVALGLVLGQLALFAVRVTLP